MNTRYTIGVTLLSLAALGSWYLANSLKGDVVETSRAKMMQNGFYVKNARILGTGANGGLLYQIAAEFAERSDQNEVEMRNVEITYATESSVPWTLIANTALIGNDRKYVRLSGDVVATSNEGFSGDTTEIRTQYMELEPDIFRAQTDQRVKISIGERSITATGMLALLRTNQLQLKSNVVGEFLP